MFQYYVLDGKSGRTLWSYEVVGRGLDISTPLMLRSDRKFRDSFLFRTNGRNKDENAQVWIRGSEISGQQSQDHQHKEEHNHNNILGHVHAAQITREKIHDLKGGLLLKPHNNIK